MCSDRWPDDTLFFVFEEDMEFFPQGIIPGRSDEAVSSSKSSNDKIPAGMGSIFCSDLVKIATKAHRIGKGEFVWFGYQPWGHEPRKKSVTWPRLGFGSQGIMMTKKAARSIKVFLSSGWKRAGHIDMLLKQWCCDSERFSGGGSCFVWPPVGSYRAHLSDCCPDQFKEDERPSCWHQDWACPGTRPLHDPHGRPKKLMLPVDKGHQEVLAVMDDGDFVGQKLSWSTWLDPGLELYMLRGTERQKRAGRKQVHEMNNKRILLKEKEKVPSNETQFVPRWFAMFGQFITLICLCHMICICGPCPPPPSVCILLMLILGEVSGAIIYTSNIHCFSWIRAFRRSGCVPVDKSRFGRAFRRRICITHMPVFTFVIFRQGIQSLRARAGSG